MKKPIDILLWVWMALLISSCNKESCEDPVPVLKIKKIELSSVSSVATFEILDCDGDIGLAESDTMGAFRYNAFVDIRPFLNGEWASTTWDFVDTSYREIKSDSGLVIGFDTIIDTLNYYYRIPIVENNSRTDIYEAEVDLDLGTSYFGFDTFRFEIHIVDRALNKSNIATSETQISRFM